MTAVLYTQHFVQFFDNNGDPLNNGKLFAYSAGTTTPKPTYTTEQADVQNPHPIVLDAAGRATVFITGSYRFDLFDENNVLIKSTDNVTSFTALNETGDPFFQSFSGDGSQTAFTLSEPLGTDSKDILVFVDGGSTGYVTNGTFDTDTDWTKGAGWTITGGEAVATGAISTALSQDSAVQLTDGVDYIITYTITRSAGTITPNIGGTAGTGQTADGTYSEVITAGATQVISFTTSGFTGTVDNVVVELSSSAGYQVQNPSAYTLSGTSLTFNTAPAGGVDNIYVYAPTKLLGAAAASAAAAAASEGAAAASASAAADSAASASAASLVITSNSSVTIGTGTKTFTVIEDLAIAAGQWLIITSNANPATNYMTGQITSYSSTTLEVNVTQAFGSGTLTDWSMKLSGVEGIQGIQGPTGALAPGAGIVVSNNDTNPDTLEQKLLVSGPLTLSTQNDGGNETRTITATLLDEDDFASNSDTAPPSQQSTKAYVDSVTSSGVLSNMTNLTVAGNVSGSAANAAEVTILDEDDMSTNSDTALATQQSIKAYVDTNAGSITKKTAQTASASAALQFEDVFTIGKNYQIELTGITPQSDGVDILLRVRVGSSYVTTGYRNIWEKLTDGAGAPTKSYNSAPVTSAHTVVKDQRGAGSGDADATSSATIMIYNPMDSVKQTQLTSRSVGEGSGVTQYLESHTARVSLTEQVNGFEIYASSGNLASGTVTVHEIDT